MYVDYMYYVYLTTRAPTHIWCPRTKLSTSYVSAILHSGLRFGCLLHFTHSHLQASGLDSTRV